MANFDRSGMTQAGINLMGKAVGGATIQFTKLVLGDGEMTGEILDLKGVVSAKQNVDVTRIERKDNQCTVGGELLTSSVKQGFFWRECGLYAMDPQLGEILYNYAYSTKPDYIAASDSGMMEEILVSMIATVGSNTNVDVIIDTSMVFATKKVVDDIANKQLKFVTYEMFGAKSDGEYDDGIAINATHEFANLHNLPVVNNSGEYWIKSNRNIPVMTSTHLGSSVFHIDEKCFNGSVFNINQKGAFETIIDANGLYSTILTYLTKGKTPVIPELSQYRNHLLIFMDENNKTYARFGDNATSGSPMQDICYINDNGKIEGEITWNYTGLTHINVIPLKEDYVVFDGGVFLLSCDSANSTEQVEGYYRPGVIRCERSRTKLTNIYIGFENGVSENHQIGVGGLIKITNAYDVIIDTVRNAPTSTVSNGSSYGFSLENVLKLTLRNIDSNASNKSWGVVGANYIKDVYVENCKFNRFDSHKHAWNITFKHCVIGTKGLTLIGGGNLICEDVISECDKFLNSRTDYGCIWNGDITIKNCMLRPSSEFTASSLTPCIFHFSTNNYNYKTDVVHGRNIVVEDFTFDYANLSPTCNEPRYYASILNASDLTVIGDRFYLPDSIVFRRVSRLRPINESGDKTELILINAIPLAKVTQKGTYGTGVCGEGYMPNCKIVIEDCHVNDYRRLTQTHNAGIILFTNIASEPLYSEYTPYYEITILRCKHVKVKIHGLPTYLKINDSEVCTIDLTATGDVNDANILAFIEFNKCTIKVNGTSVQYGTDARTGFYLNKGKNARFINCHFELPIIDDNTAGKQHITRMFGNSIADFVNNPKVIKTNMVGTTIDSRMATLVGLTHEQLHEIYRGFLYKPEGTTLS